MTDSLNLPFPFEGDFRVSQAFGQRPEYYARWHLAGHNGIDFALPSNTPVLAVDAGRVVMASYDENGYGVFIKIRHAWGFSLYAHLLHFGIWSGAEVTQGQVIGQSGNSGISSGPHLHFGMQVLPFDRSDPFGGYSDPGPHLTRPGINMSARHSGVDFPSLPVAAASEEDEAAIAYGLDWYQQAALRTWNPSGTEMEQLAYLSLGGGNEWGEAQGIAKKVLAHGWEWNEETKAALAEEVEDALWYGAVLLHFLGRPLSEGAFHNIEKLADRYREGFSQEASLKRKERKKK